MASGVVTLRGRFKAGSRVRLVRVEHEGVLRPSEDAEVLAEKTVDADGCVQFSDGVEVGARYFIVGQVDGTPLEVRARGNRPDDDNPVLALAPVQPDRQKLASGAFQDELVPATSPREVTDPPRVEQSGLVSQRPEPEEAPKPKASHSARKTSTKKAAPKSAGKSTTAKSGDAPARKEK